MRTVKEPEWEWPEEDDEDEDPSEKYWENLYEAENTCIFDWNDSGGDILDTVDVLLADHGLEIVEYDGHGGTFTVFSIEKINDKSST